MLRSKEREIEPEEKEYRIMHPDEPIEEMISTGLPKETEEGEELEKKAAGESKLRNHKEEREGNTGEELKPSEESHGLHRWFGFFSPRKPGGESGEVGGKDEDRKVMLPSSDEIIAGDSWQHGGGDGVMDGSNVHSPTEKGPLRDEEPTEMAEKTFFNVRGRYKGESAEKMAVATSQVIFDLSIDVQYPISLEPAKKVRYNEVLRN